MHPDALKWAVVLLGINTLHQRALKNCASRMNKPYKPLITHIHTSPHVCINMVKTVSESQAGVSIPEVSVITIWMPLEITPALQG